MPRPKGSKVINGKLVLAEDLKKETVKEVKTKLRRKVSNEPKVNIDNESPSKVLADFFLNKRIFTMENNGNSITFTEI